MVAIRIKQAVHARRYSVIGQDAAGSQGVKHVGLLSFDDHLDHGKLVRVFDMLPPMRFGDPGDTMCAHTVGYLDPLTAEQQRKIELWLSERKTEAVRCEYRVRPAFGLEVEPGTQRIQLRWYSCAGFVASCYEDAGVALVDQAALPRIGRSQIREIWGLSVRRDVLDRVMSTLGLDGDGPWQVLLPGYLLHAFNSKLEQLPYAPRPTDWQFP